MPTSNTPRREPAFLWLFFGKVVLLMVTIAVVYPYMPICTLSGSIGSAGLTASCCR